METKDIIFFIAVFVGSAALIGLFYLLDHRRSTYKNFNYENFKPKFDHAKAEKLAAQIYGNHKEDENPEEEPVKKNLWDRILEAIGL